MIEVELSAVRVDLRSNTPVLLLQELNKPKRTLPIFIGAPEATAIALAIQEIDTPRPMTHDLLKNVIDELDSRLVRVTITELRESTYYAELTVTRGNKTYSISSRPSDAIALAIRVPAPIYVADDLLESEGVSSEILDEDRENTLDEQTPEQLVGEFREFLDNLKPEDFSG
ncbi:MAG: bifunctional nuclease family protein [Acidimicrobiaceae bacterium]|nr:bifunctional nuclease family protein [Acidimicrobiaceae bacterium]